jgi:hypothetical protein
MKKIIVFIFFLLNQVSLGQGYYPKLDNLFFNDETENSLFNDDINYFKIGLKTATNKLFYGDLQTSNNGNASFYGMKIIPRFLFEFDFLNTGMFIKYNPSSKEKFPSFQITFHEYVNETPKGDKTGSGTIDIYEKGLSLIFNSNQIKSYDLTTKKIVENQKATFFIETIEYKFEKTGLEIQLKGAFNNAIKIKTDKFDSNSISTILIKVKKEAFLVTCFNPKTNKEIIVIEEHSKKI